MNTNPVENVPAPAAPAIIDHLRPYQKRDYRDVLKRCETVRSVLYVAFMGSGKTVLASALIRTWVARGERILILTHTREILRQTHEKLHAAGIDEKQIGWIWRNHPRTNSSASIQLASLDTFIRRDFPEGITRIVIDEAHHATAQKWRRVLEAYPNARVLGLTGTPVRLDGQPLGTVFEEMIESEPTENLIEQGWIARPSYWTPMWNVELPRRSGLDFGDLVAAGMLPHAKVLESMIAEYTKHAAGLPALGFAATREKAIQYAAHFVASGIPADTLFGSDTDLKRQGTLARLRKGALRVLWTCNVLGEGWDYPGLRCVMLARPTLSTARYLQQVARCMRPGDPPVVLDLWGAWDIFDPPWANFGWSLQAKARKTLYIGKRDAEGEVTWLPPVEVEGELVRADSLMRTPCSVCENPATRNSVYNARVRGTKPYCVEHIGGPSAKKELLPCTVCGAPATRLSSANARARGQKPYCTEHAGPKSVRQSKVELLPCAICGEPSTYSSTLTARHIGSKPYCTQHKGGGDRKDRLPCATCGKPATRASSDGASSRGGGAKAYCIEHTGGPSAAKAAIPCATCGKPATRSSANTSRLYGHKAYCVDHMRGQHAKKPLLLCAVCGEPATRKSSNSARVSGGNAYCVEHFGGTHKKKPRLPCVVCGKPATAHSSLYAPITGAVPYCMWHEPSGQKERRPYRLGTGGPKKPS